MLALVRRGSREAGGDSGEREEFVRRVKGEFRSLRDRLREDHAAAEDLRTAIRSSEAADLDSVQDIAETVLDVLSVEGWTVTPAAGTVGSAYSITLGDRSRILVVGMFGRTVMLCETA